MRDSFASRFRAASFVKSNNSWHGFHAVLRTCVDIFKENNIPIDRIQIPLSKLSGFLHPTIQTAILTWTSHDDQIELDIIPHDWLKIYPGPESLQERLKNTPYYEILFGGAVFTHYPLLADVPAHIEILGSLQQRGYADYYALKLELQQGSIQVVSVATKSQTGFDWQVLSDVYQQLEPVLSLALYAAYQTSVAAEIARTYLGDRTGKRVLQGEIMRGVSTSLEAGIMFCDLRGFTSLNLRLGAEKTVEVMNQVFDKIGQVMESSPAEILKFIGDALLIVLPVSEFVNLEEVKLCMLDLATRSHALVRDLGVSLDLPLSVGFGGHLGKVVYGNVGTSSRFDFTVMGPEVNLAARLESMCSQLNVFYLMSSQALPATKLIQNMGEHMLKGIDKPVAMWGLVDDDPQA
jgi:adenylate cyclase